MDPVKGLVQHSFAMQLTDPRRPFLGHTTEERVAERFSLSSASGPYSVRQVGVVEDLRERADSALHSSIARNGLTTVGSLQLDYLECEGRLPEVFDWSVNPKAQCRPVGEQPQLIFADDYDRPGRPTINDFWVDAPGCDSQPLDASRALLEVLAHMRSRLFGFALANRFVNVMLPPALLWPTGSSPGKRAWQVQPLVSFIRGGRERNRLRSTYCLTLFFLPVRKAKGSLGSRSMSKAEIAEIVNAGWGYASSPPPPSLTKFDLSGPLLGYLARLARFDLRRMRPQASFLEAPAPLRETWEKLTLRQAAERVALGVALSLAQGKSGGVGKRAAQIIGNEVLMALGGSARVSSVVVVDPELTVAEVQSSPGSAGPFPGKLLPLMRKLAKPARIGQCSNKQANRYRIDRPFVDDDSYVVGVLPSKRCTVVVSRGGAQCGIRESALMQAGSVAYMTLGAATAIGTMRAIDRKVEALEAADPTEVAEIDREIAADLDEIYDLDITREAYREIYRRLRNRLGIKRDYKTLRDEMQTLYRATSTFHEHKAERLLALLTAAIVVLSLFILLGTVVLVGNGG